MTLDPAPGNSLVNGQLVKRRGLVADWAQPLWALLLQLQVRRRVEALDVVAADAAAWQAESHVGQRALEAQVLRRGNHIGVGRLFRDWTVIVSGQSCKRNGNQRDSLSAMTDSLRIFFWIWATSVSIGTDLETIRLR